MSQKPPQPNTPFPEQADTMQPDTAEDDTTDAAVGAEKTSANEAPAEVSGDVFEATFSDDSKAELLDNLVLAHREIDKLKEDYIRAKADIENIRRRSQNEIISARKYAIDGFARELLSVLDSLDQAARVEIISPNGEGNGAVASNMKEGLELTLKQFNKVMEKFGVTAVEATPGTKFNPEIHQAISVLASAEIAPEHILEVMQKGFLLKDRLLRPAMVVIAKRTEK